MDAENSDEPDYTEYTDLAFIGLPAENPQGQEYTYSVTLGAKPNYSATVESMQTLPEDIDCGFDATLDFAPICFDLAFGVKVPGGAPGHAGRRGFEDHLLGWSKGRGHHPA